MPKPRSRFAIGLAALLAVSVVEAANICGGITGSQMPALTPQMPSAKFAQSDEAIDCFMWQTFIFLNWPAAAGQRGQPDPNAAFGSDGMTVWESFKKPEEVFLPAGVAPGPWDDSTVSKTMLRARGVPSAAPNIRLLNNRSEFFRPLVGVERTALQSIIQAGGGTLYDQVKTPVYYEVLMDKTSFDYIVGNQLYNATKQVEFATTTGIDLPTGSIEVKAAWKVLTPNERNATPVRFHTAQALLPGGTTPVTVGLVGLHIFQMPSPNFSQGFWATFEQMDNAPLSSGGTQQASYSFNNPACNPASCPPNQKQGNPTQVVQMFNSTPKAAAVNAYVVNTLAPQGPWRFYQLIDVQWPTSSVPVGAPGQSAPLPNGTPNTMTMINPVLETFLQKSGNSCLGCHTHANTAQASSLAAAPNLAASYSFLLGHAKSPAVSTKRGAAAPGK